MWINPQFSADLFTFNKEILNGNFVLRAVTKTSTSDTDSKSFGKKKAKSTCDSQRVRISSVLCFSNKGSEPVIKTPKWHHDRQSLFSPRFIIRVQRIPEELVVKSNLSFGNDSSAVTNMIPIRKIGP